MNRKLFDHVRSGLSLAYDVSFRLRSLDSSVLTPLPGAGPGAPPALSGGWYQIEVLSSSKLLARATQACRDVIKAVAQPSVTGASLQITAEDVAAATRAVQDRVLSKERFSLDYWIAQLSGSQMSKHYTSMVTVDREALLQSITVGDVTALLRRIRFGASGKEFVCTASD
jgi:hypothetical protein